MAENFRYAEENTIIKDILSQGVIGEALYFIQNTGADFQKEMLGNTFAAKEWRQHPEFEGGIFLDGAVHDIARMRFLFGTPIPSLPAQDPSRRTTAPTPPSMR